jgi:hypothetical protein
MTIKHAEFLLLVAMVTSAAVVELREHTLTPAPQQATQPATCRAMQQGIAPAGCEVKRSDERRVDGTQHLRHDEPGIWV